MENQGHQGIASRFKAKSVGASLGRGGWGGGDRFTQGCDQWLDVKDGHLKSRLSGRWIPMLRGSPLSMLGCGVLNASPEEGEGMLALLLGLLELPPHVFLHRMSSSMSSIRSNPNPNRSLSVYPERVHRQVCPVPNVVGFPKSLLKGFRDFVCIYSEVPTAPGVDRSDCNWIRSHCRDHSKCNACTF